MDIKFIKLREEHLTMVMNWRMLPDVTRYMNTDPVLTLESQKIWFEKISNDSTLKYWVIEKNNLPVGVINLANIDFINSHTSWGYYVAKKEDRTLKLAIQIDCAIYDYVLNDLKLNKLYSEVFLENNQVVQLHKLTGSKEEGILRSHVKKNDKYYDIVILSILRDEWNFKKKNLSFKKINFE